MKYKTIYMFLVILTTVLLPIQSLAVCPDPNTVTTVPKLVNVAVKADVTLDPKTKIYSYSYSIENSSENIGCIWWFEIDIKRPGGGIDLPKEGLINSLKYASLDIPDEDAPAMIPVTFPSLPKVDIIIWGAGLTGRGGAHWSSKGYTYQIEPGSTLAGLILTTYGLPTVRDFKIEPKYIAEKEDVLKMGVSEKDLYANTWKYFNAFYDSIAWKGKTIGPTAPPADFKPIDFLNNIINMKHEAVSLGWIKDKGIEQSLDSKLDNAKKKIEQGNNTAAKNILEAFIHEVEAQKDKHMTSEAYGLLKYNVQYLIERL